MAAGVKHPTSTPSGAGTKNSPPADTISTPVAWYRSTAGLGLVGSLLMWIAQPPFDIGPLGWFAAVPWLLLIRQRQLSGKHPYRVLYLVGMLYWGATFYWLTLPHWSTIFGWIAMFVYLAWYLVLFVALARVAVHRLRVPLIFAAPAVWVGLELVRAHFATGVLVAALGHTQYRWITLIQASDLVGAYGISFLVMFAAASLAAMLPVDAARFRFWPLALGVIAVVAALVYGHVRMDQYQGADGPKTALIQGSIDTEFDIDVVAVRRRMYDQYMHLTFDALREDPEIEVVIWPESMYVAPLVLIDKGAYLPAAELVQIPEIGREEATRWEADRQLPPMFQEMAAATRMQFRRTAQEIRQVAASGRGAQTSTRPTGPLIMLGLDGQRYMPGRALRYNTSVLLDGSGEVVDFYHKMHLVMFGEYVPLGNWIPWLYTLTPLDGGLSAGTSPTTYDVAGTAYAPNICYETVLPHVIRRQVIELARRGDEPDVLVTQTNDGWFWGSAALDMHLICGVFRAVECRKPLLIAANTGLSASIDGSGRILVHGEHQEKEFLIARPQLDSRHSAYLLAGDWFAGLCGLCCAVLAVVGLVLRRRGATRWSSRFSVFHRPLAREKQPKG